VYRCRCEHDQSPRQPAALGWVLAASRLEPAADRHAVMGWVLGCGTEWCCQHLYPAFLGPLGVSQAGANAGGMRAIGRGGRGRPWAA
jgi:hypothetical protein